MTFSLRPSSVSILPLSVASVRTRVVSWKEAAEMNDRVCRLALVIPSSTGTAVKPDTTANFDHRIQFLKFELVHLLVLE